MAVRYVVRYGAMRNLGDFAARGNAVYPRGCAVIVRSDRGTEWGEVLCPSTSRTKSLLQERNSGGRILREATDDDSRKLDEVHRMERKAFDGCRDMIRERKLQMQLVDVERLFGGERLVFYYLAEKRVDFRELVKSLAKRFHTRVEMRQIGVRDEARLLADYGDCGKPVCCNTHLRTMPPVSMKMAKLQKATLDPSKISGRCGRLKCCLRYEYETYVEFRRELPKIGAVVLTKSGQGKVVAQEILARKVIVRYDGGRDVMTDETEILTVVTSSSKGQSGSTSRSAGNPSRGKSPANGGRSR